MMSQIFTIIVCTALSFLCILASRKNRFFIFFSSLSLLLLLCFSVFKGYKLESKLISFTNIISISLFVGFFSFRWVRNKSFALIFSLLFGSMSILWWFGYLNPVFTLTKQTHIKIGSNDLSLYSLLQAGFVVSLSVWGAYLISNWFDSMIKKSTLQVSMQILVSKLFKISTFFLSFLLGLNIVGVDISVFAFFGGAVALGIGFGLQNIVSNLFCGAILLVDRSIKPGDVIALNEGKIIGVVHKLTARYVMLRTQEGKEHLVPNDYFIKNKVENWSYSDRLIRIDFALKLPFESNLDEMKDLLLEAASYEKQALKTPAPSVRFTQIIDNAIEVKLRVWITNPEKGASTIRSHVIYTIWKLLKEKDIQLPSVPLDVCIRQESSLKHSE